MKLSRIRYFNDEISKDSLINGVIGNFAIYYFFNEKFHALDGQTFPEAINTSLEKTRKKKESWREPSNTTTYFYSEEFDAVVVANFIKAPRVDTQNFFSLALANCARHANNAFHAAHDTLTELLNRLSLEQQLNNIISTIVPISSADLAGQQQIAILAFDIDHFKQVNDTHGHNYGDLVLKSFARRLETISQKLSDEGSFKGGIEFSIARPGGEEFTVTVKGTLSDKDVCDLASRFCEEIAAKEMPTPAEWKNYEKQCLTTGLQFPSDPERRITCSIGVVCAGLPISGTDINQARMNLINRADLALYKAKTSGRNRICFYPEIVKRFGRIMEVQQDTDIVVIDLGSEVGLKYGQELLVFHPKFDGSTDYIYQDGRTNKRMGAYPRMHSARIEVFDVQKKISFCRILEKIAGTSGLIKDSWLEAIPLGSIDHLVKSNVGGLISTNTVVGPVSADAIKNKILQLKDKRPFCAVFRIANESAAIDNLGSASINKVLADLYNALQKQFSWNAVIGYIQPTQFALVMANKSENQMNLIANALTETNERYGGKIRVISGIFSPDEAEKEAKNWRDNKINYDKILELASLVSIVPEASETESYKIFNFSTLAEVVANIESTKGQKQALTDLRKLSEFGIYSAWFENTIGRLAFGTDNYDLALESVRSATDLDSTTTIYRANLALIFYYKEMFKEAYSTFIETENIMKDSVPKEYLGAWAISADHARKLGEDIEKEKIIMLYDLALKNESLQFFCKPDDLRTYRERLIGEL